MRVTGVQTCALPICSNALSVPADSLLFNLVAFAGAPGFTALLIAQIVFGEIVVKYTVGLLYALARPRREHPSVPAEPAGLPPGE